MVIVVIGIMASLAVMTIGGNAAREFRRDAARIQQVLAMAQDEAPYAGEEIGFWIDPEGKSYQFLRFDDSKLDWKPYEQEGFSQHSFPAQFTVELEMSGDPVDLAKLYEEIYKLDKKSGKKKKKDKGPVPSLVFFSDGHYTPFRLRLINPLVDGFAFELRGDGLGDIRVREVETGWRRAGK